jgi:hypothetical protein
MSVRSMGRKGTAVVARTTAAVVGGGCFSGAGAAAFSWRRSRARWEAEEPGLCG